MAERDPQQSRFHIDSEGWQPSSTCHNCGAYCLSNGRPKCESDRIGKATASGAIISSHRDCPKGHTGNFNNSGNEEELSPTERLRRMLYR